MQVQQVRHQRLALGRFRAARVGQDGCDFGVGETRVAEHHRRVKLVGVDFAFGVDQHVADHAQALDVRVQRTQAVGELLGQHGNHAARKINAGRTVIGVDIDRTAGFHIVAHVGNRHQQTPALAAADLGRLAINRIVKVTGVFTVDGHQRNVGQVHAAFFVGGAHGVGQGARQGQRGIAELMRHAVFAHRNFNFHARVVDFPEHFLDAANRLSKQRRRLGQLDHHDLSGLGRADGALGDQHILAVTLVLGRHQPDTAFLQQAANDGVGGTFNDFRDAAFGPVLAVMPHDARLDAVLVQHGTHFVGRQVDVGFAVIAQHEAMAIAVA